MCSVKILTGHTSFTENHQKKKAERIWKPDVCSLDMKVVFRVITIFSKWLLLMRNRYEEQIQSAKCTVCYIKIQQNMPQLHKSCTNSIGPLCTKEILKRKKKKTYIDKQMEWWFHLTASSYHSAFIVPLFSLQLHRAHLFQAAPIVKSQPDLILRVTRTWFVFSRENSTF